MTLEETAKIQLEKLIQRSLVHIVSREPLNGNILAGYLCKVHDLLRELTFQRRKKLTSFRCARGGILSRQSPFGASL